MNSQSIHNKLIHDQLARGDFNSAEPLIYEKLKHPEELGDAHYLLGVLHYLKGELGEAIENLKKALFHDPQHTDAAVCLSVLCNDIGKYDEAKSIFEQANQSIILRDNANHLEINRKFAVKHLELADLYFRYRWYDEAIEEYSKAIRLDPKDLDIRIRRAKAFAKKGFITRAIQDLQQMKTENPRFLTARIQLGLLYFSQNNVLDAELEWDHILAIDPENQEAAAYLKMAKQSHLKRV